MHAFVWSHISEALLKHLYSLVFVQFIEWIAQIIHFLPFRLFVNSAIDFFYSVIDEVVNMVLCSHSHLAVNASSATNISLGFGTFIHDILFPLFKQSLLFRWWVRAYFYEALVEVE